MRRLLLAFLLLTTCEVLVHAQPGTFTPTCAGVNDTAAFSSIITAIGANTGTIRIPYKSLGGQRCAVNNLTIPANVTLDNSDGTGVKVNTGQALTVVGPVVSPPKSLFYNATAGLGTVSFSGNKTLSAVWPLWWGGAGDATTAGVGTDNYPAWLAAMTAVATLDSNTYRGVDMPYPYGSYYFSAPLIPTRQVVIRGVNEMNDIGPTLSSIAGGGTVFYFADGVNGINLTNPGSGTNAGYTTVKNLSVISKGKTGATAHGILLTARASVENVLVTHFKGDGIRIIANSTDTPATNANNWLLRNVRTTYNDGNGLHALGDSANAGLALYIDASHNGGAGIFDESYLGNTYIAPHAEQNTGPGFKNAPPILGVQNKSVFIGAYEEGNAANELYGPTIAIGGTFSDGFTAGSTVGRFIADGITGDLQLLIGTNANTKQNVGITIKQGEDQAEIISLKRIGVAHGMTVIAETDTYAFYSNGSGANGGLWIAGLTTTARAMLIDAYATTEVTTQTSSDQGAIDEAVSKKSGTSSVAMGATASLRTLRNASTTVFWWTGGGDFKLARNLIAKGVVIRNQSTPSTPTTATTLTVANLLIGILTATPTATGATVAYTLPTGTLMSGGDVFDNNGSFDWSITNLAAAAADTITITAGVDHTIVGNPIIQSSHVTTGGITGNAAVFRSRKISATVWVTYRIS